MQLSPQPPQDPLVGTLATGRYRVLKLLGEGGMGRVYLAEHVAIQKRLALKVLRSEYAHKGEIVQRFQQEAISASRIKHPNVLDVFDFGQLENGCFYLAMEFLDGNDLADELARRRVFDPVSGIRIALQICRALGAAHSNGVVHRDLKPENVFLQRTMDGEEVVKIVDFGIAQLRDNEQAERESKHRRLTRTGMVFGTPEYMAPEQAEGHHADQRADVYALGVMLYEMFTGAVPFTGETFLGVLAKHLHEAPPPMTQVTQELWISPQLQAVIMKALVKKPDDRYASMADFSQALSATPEGALSYRPPPMPGGEARGSFIPPAPSNPTAPEFGVVTGPPVTPVPAANRATLAQGSGSTPPDAERTETPLASERNRTRSGSTDSTASRLPLVLGVSAALLLGGIGAALTFRSKAPAPAPAVAEPKPTAEPKASAASEAAPPQAPSAVESAAAPSHVKLEVLTEPAGATVSKNGFQVCDSTPCEVLADVNETLELAATKGTLRGRAKVLAQRDQRVQIALAAPAAPPKPSNAPGTRLCEVLVGDLKVLRPCP